MNPLVFIFKFCLAGELLGGRLEVDVDVAVFTDVIVD